jgi:hypothetical protein
MSVAPRPGETPPSPPAPAAPYEFSDAHKETFRALAASMSFVGVCTFLFGALSVVFALGEAYEGFVPNAVGTAVVAALYVVVAIWMLSAGRALSGMLRTRGRDIEYLMEAVVPLRRLFGLMRVVIIVVALLVVLAAVAVVWCTMARGANRCFGFFG